MEQKKMNLVQEDQYIIHEYTMAVLPFYTENGVLHSLVYEKYRIIEVYKSPKMIIQDSCHFYGSSLIGRVDSALTILKKKRMIPILISESHNICMIPLSAFKKQACVWIAYKHVVDIMSMKNGAIITFSNHEKVKVELTKMTLERKLDIAGRLVSTYDLRNENIKQLHKHQFIAEDIDAYVVVSEFDGERFFH
ncbi:competence protein ComK [Metabacillus litoralis]|uniref:competence protein ComK n=1 Tax=Metabacillus litoralis TaxID=152268 RepID=UPI001CFD626D|nr:competence protein ComK [Metabacillus litoralis]